jgi:hypothetical protein
VIYSAAYLGQGEAGKMRFWLIISVTLLFLIDLGVDGRIGGAGNGGPTRSGFGIYASPGFAKTGNYYCIVKDKYVDTQSDNYEPFYKNKLSRPLNRSNILTDYQVTDRSRKYRPPP